MKKTIALLLLAGISYAGTHAQENRPATFSDLTITGSCSGPGCGTGGSGVSVYPATATASFPFGFSASTATFGNGSTMGSFDLLKGNSPGNPATDQYRVYFDSTNADALTSRNSSGVSRVYASTASNVATATALAANPTNCSSGQSPLGIDASGNVESCFTAGGGADASSYGYCFISHACTEPTSTVRAVLISTMTNKNVVMKQVVVPYKVKLGRYVIYAVSGFSTNAVTMGMYTDSSGVPGAQIAGSSFTKVDLNVTYAGGVWGTGAVTLDPGVYWIAFAQEGTSAQYLQDYGNFGSIEFFGSANTPKLVTCTNNATGGGSTLALPSTCGTAASLTTFGVSLPIVLSTAN